MLNYPLKTLPFRLYYRVVQLLGIPEHFLHLIEIGQPTVNIKV